MKTVVTNGHQLIYEEPESFRIVSVGPRQNQPLEDSEGFHSGQSKAASSSRKEVSTTRTDPLQRHLFQEVRADEVPPPVGPLVVVASLRKTGNPAKRKLHLLGCGWTLTCPRFRA